MNSVNWPALVRATAPALVTGRIWRVVESQQQVATTALVDDLAEQAVLENLLEASKPAYPPECERLHYLLKTPFRYPPLRWGSRFGSRFEPGIFYAAHLPHTALTETAFYRLLFLHGMQEPFSKLLSQHVMFAARCHTGQGVKLQNPPFAEHTAQLTDPASYAQTQALGSLLRDAGFLALEFISARDRQGGINVALMTPAALRSREPEKIIRVLAQTSGQGVSFKYEGELVSYPRDDFLVNGQLPEPA